MTVFVFVAFSIKSVLKLSLLIRTDNISMNR